MCKYLLFVNILVYWGLYFIIFIDFYEWFIEIVFSLVYIGIWCCIMYNFLLCVFCFYELFVENMLKFILLCYLEWFVEWVF